MYKISYDSNPCEANQEEVPDLTTSPVEYFLKSLCEDNKRNLDDGDPLGPVAFGKCDYGDYLISAWTSGRQWFYIVEIYSPTKFLGDEDSMYKLCVVPLLQKAGIQAFDDEDVSEE